MNCVLDTDVVIAALDRRDAHHDAASAAFNALLADETPLLLSVVNYAEALVRPAAQPQTLRIAEDAIAALGIRVVAPTAAVGREAARCRGLNISLADGFALATARAHSASVATFDRRVRRALSQVGLKLAPALGA